MGATFGLLERGAALAEVVRHRAERREHWMKLAGGMIRQRYLSLSARYGASSLAQGADGTRELSRGDGARPECRDGPKDGGKQHQHAEITAPTIEQEIIHACRRCQHEASLGVREYAISQHAGGAIERLGFRRAHLVRNAKLQRPAGAPP